MLPFECLNYNTLFHIGALATFWPTECLIAPPLYLPRAGRVPDDARARPGILHGHFEEDQRLEGTRVGFGVSTLAAAIKTSTLGSKHGYAASVL